jgi:hypothetical protein
MEGARQKAVPYPIGWGGWAWEYQPHLGKQDMLENTTMDAERQFRKITKKRLK